LSFVEIDAVFGLIGSTFLRVEFESHGIKNIPLWYEDVKIIGDPRGDVGDLLTNCSSQHDGQLVHTDSGGLLEEKRRPNLYQQKLESGGIFHSLTRQGQFSISS
jgi:hypothetical protein